MSDTAIHDLVMATGRRFKVQNQLRINQLRIDIFYFAFLSLMEML